MHIIFLCEKIFIERKQSTHTQTQEGLSLKKTCIYSYDELFQMHTGIIRSHWPNFCPTSRKDVT